VSFRLSLFWKRLLLFAVGAAACVLIYLFLLNFPGLGPSSVTLGIIPLLVIAATTWSLTLRFLRADGMPRSALGLGRSDHRAARIGIGFLGGSALTLVWFAIVTLTTGAKWHPNPGFHVVMLMGACAFNFLNNVGEELVYRGYAFVRLADRFGPYITAVATSALFALLHLQAGIPWLSVSRGRLQLGPHLRGDFCAVAQRTPRPGISCRDQHHAGCLGSAYQRGIAVRSRIPSNSR
jgi:membrane protease YdiL (CAAX protease family)